MRQAFVLKLGAGTDTARRHFAGFIEEVDTGRDLRFWSTDELLNFLGQCFDEALRSSGKPAEPGGDKAKEGG